MGKNKDLYDKALKAVKKDSNILFMDDVIAACGVSRSTFYRHIPVDSDQYNDIWDTITQNRVVVKRHIRMKLRDSGKASELLALYRMICTDEERRAINQQYVEMSGEVDNMLQIEFISGNGISLKHSENEVDTTR